jgi:hypothetical protein
MPGRSKKGGGLESTYKMKSAPVNMRTPGSIAKMAGVSPVKDISNLGKAIVAGVKGFADGSRNTLTDGIKQGYEKAKKAYNSKKSPVAKDTGKNPTDMEKIPTLGAKKLSTGSYTRETDEYKYHTSKKKAVLPKKKVKKAKY